VVIGMFVPFEGVGLSFSTFIGKLRYNDFEVALWSAYR